jgi:hypothetical protein
MAVPDLELEVVVQEVDIVAGTYIGPDLESPNARLAEGRKQVGVIAVGKGTWARPSHRSK